MENQEQLEELTNDLIESIWPLLDEGISKGEIEAVFRNVMDSYEPEG